MSDQPPARVRVTAPTGATTRRREASSRLHDSAPVGEIYVRSLIRAQLRLALRTLAALTLLVGGLPALFVLRPGLAAVAPGGIPLAWLLLGVLVYPVLLVLGWRHLREAERLERDVADLVRRGPRPPTGTGTDR